MKTRHGVRVLLAPSFPHTGYVVSHRTAVERREAGDLGSTASANRLVAKVRELLALYPRVCVVVEEEGPERQGRLG